MLMIVMMRCGLWVSMVLEMLMLHPVLGVVLTALFTHIYVWDV